MPRILKLVEFESRFKGEWLPDRAYAYRVVIETIAHDYVAMHLTTFTGVKTIYGVVRKITVTSVAEVTHKR